MSAEPPNEGPMLCEVGTPASLDRLSKARWAILVVFFLPVLTMIVAEMAASGDNAVVIAIVVMLLAWVGATFLSIAMRWRVEAFVEVVADGLLIVHKRSRKQILLPFREIRALVHDGKGVRLSLRAPHKGGLYVRFPARYPGDWDKDGSPFDAFTARIASGVAASRGSEEPFDETLLVRPAGTAREWVAALRREKGFRETAPPSGRLWQLVDNPSAPPETRAAAAIALTRELGEVDKRRLRVAAQATDDDALRVAFDRAAAEDEESMIEALEEIEARSAEG